MITALFCFDGPLYKDCNGKYCSITITNEMLSRYMRVCDHLYLMIRTFSSDESSEELNMPILNTENMTIVEMPNYYTLEKLIFKRKDYKIISNYVKKSDLIFARLPSQTSNMVLKQVVKYKKPYMVEVGGCAWDSFRNHGILGKIIAPYMFFLEKIYVRKATFASYVTKKFLQNRYPSNAIAVISCSNVYINTTEKALWQYTKKSSDVIVLGTAANSIDVKYKGQDSVIRAIGKLKNSKLCIKYQIVGPGSGKYLKRVAKKAGVLENVEFTGTKTKDEILEWLDNIDIYIQPSKQEGLPRALIEAMSRGCYCMGTNIAGIPELLSKEFLFRPDDENKIAKLVEEYSKLLEKEKLSIRQINYNKSREYSQEILDSKRSIFFAEYKKYVLSRRQE